MSDEDAAAAAAAAPAAIFRRRQVKADTVTEDDGVIASERQRGQRNRSPVNNQ